MFVETTFKKKCVLLTVMIDDSAARAIQSRGRLMCWIPSVPGNLRKVKAVNGTWVRRCDHHVFFIEGLSSADNSVDVASLHVAQGRSHLTAKSVTAFKYLYRHHLNDYDWFLKVGAGVRVVPNSEPCV